MSPITNISIDVFVSYCCYNNYHKFKDLIQIDSPKVLDIQA